MGSSSSLPLSNWLCAQNMAVVPLRTEQVTISKKEPNLYFGLISIFVWSTLLEAFSIAIGLEMKEEHGNAN